jgi:hypothetical protein
MKAYSDVNFLEPVVHEDYVELKSRRDPLEISRYYGAVKYIHSDGNKTELVRPLGKEGTSREKPKRFTSLWTFVK